MRSSTRLVHSGRPARVPDAPLNPPITMASTYISGGDLEYGRYANPTWTAFEEAVAVLEDPQGDASCLAFASGLAAVASVLDLIGLGETVVAPRHAYNGSLAQLADAEARGRLRTRLVDVTDADEIAAACDDAALLWLESPTNPAMEVVDIAAAVRHAHDAGARVAVDNTFATPLLQRPFEHGADIVVHSATKYLSGHSDLLLGAVLTRDAEVASVLKIRRDIHGAIPGTMEAWLALRGMRTLAVRLERAQASARALAERLGSLQALSEVRYPGFGAMLAIVLPDAAAADRVVAATRLWARATSLGGVESTLERRRRWASEPASIPEGLIRLSVGIEDVEDLWDDLEQAIGASH